MFVVKFFFGCIGNVDLGKKRNFYNANKILASSNSYFWSWDSLDLINPFWRQVLVMNAHFSDDAPCNCRITNLSNQKVLVSFCSSV